MRRLLAGAVIPVLLALLFAAPIRAAEVADAVYRNARIYKVDAGRGWAEAVAIRGDRFIAVGADADMKAHIGPSTRVVDLGGRMAMPGIHDMHIHPVGGALTVLYGCEFPASLTLEQVVEAVAACAAKQPPGTWIRGGAFGANLLQAARKPDKALLDAAVPEHPVMIRSSGGHSAWVNSKALALAGIDRNTPQPAKGEIVRDRKTGEPTGLLHEGAGALVSRVIPEYTPEQHLEAVRWLSADLSRQGVTAIKDAATTREVAAAFADADRAGALSLRVGLSLTWRSAEEGTPGEQAALIEERERYRTALVAPDFIKIFVDGSAGARKAAYLEPYQPDGVHPSDYRGELLVDPAELARYLIDFDRRGLMVKMHCGGDWAKRVALDAIEAARKANGDSGLRHEVAHSALIHPDDIPRFSRLNATAELSPMYWHPNRIVDLLTGTLGQERAGRLWQLRTLHEAGAFMVYGSDWPAVVPNSNPWRGIEAMVTRKDPEGRLPGALQPNEALDLATAIEIFTRNGAHAMRLGSLSGAIEAGRYADMIVLDRNLFDTPPEEIGDTQVQLTLLGGRTVYERAK
jgi:predicted amidohydrolase YtcJ